jgi:phosphoribosylaminoimidazolecarboxamide formyltransferase/IMP cyclohydrolase
MADRRALVSVWDKTGVEEFAKGLAELGFTIVSTGGTAAALTKADVDILPIDEVTGFPEMLDGRVKTLHPLVHGGILGRRSLSSHRTTMAEAGIVPIDVVCVNLYPFEATVAREGVTHEEAVEQVDIGGPSMVRSAAKNHEDVLVVTDPDQYEEVLTALREGVTPELRKKLARAAFARTAAYDAAITEYLGREEEDALPESLVLGLVKQKELRYGENPHQRAAFYLPTTRHPEPCVANAEVLSERKGLSHINYMDLDAGFELVREFERPAAALIKHTNPCGCAEADTLQDAFVRAYECDRISAYGCVIGLNRRVDLATAEQIASPGRFVHCIVAPGYEPEALECLKTRQKWGKNLRVLDTGPLGERRPSLDLRQIAGGFLAQERNLTLLDPALPDGWEVVTERAPTEAEAADLKFAWTVVKHIKSNGIALAKGCVAVGAGFGQTSRVEAAELAVKRAGENAKGSVCASDAFFPFADGLEAPADAGATAFIQPGGSMRDKEVIEEANRRGVAMVLTKLRHFRH